jgi:hypothetical protein
MHKRKWDAVTTSIISTQPWVIRRPGSLNGDTIPAMVCNATSHGVQRWLTGRQVSAQAF